MKKIVTFTLKPLSFCAVPERFERVIHEASRTITDTSTIQNIAAVMDSGRKANF